MENDDHDYYDQDQMLVYAFMVDEKTPFPIGYSTMYLMFWRYHLYVPLEYVYGINHQLTVNNGVCLSSYPICFPCTFAEVRVN